MSSTRRKQKSCQTYHELAQSLLGWQEKQGELIGLLEGLCKKSRLPTKN
jgi:hypothetical protein